MTLPRIADDNDFESMKRLIDEHDGWNMELTKAKTQVWTRTIDGCNFNMVKMNSQFDDIPPDVVYDVLLDPDYRKDWDSNMLVSEDIGCINVNNDIGYYASEYNLCSFSFLMLLCYSNYIHLIYYNF